jgi:hypothetical protein
MLDFLARENLTDATAASHHMIQVIRQQWDAASKQPGDDLATADDPSLTPAQIQLIERIAEEIEQHEGVPVTELSEPKISEYADYLSNLLEVQSRTKLKADPAKGRSLLEKLQASSRY